jgi:uncharacterized protein
MWDDDLTTPLGQFPVHRGSSPGKAIYAAVGLICAGLLLSAAAAFLPGLRPPPTPLIAANAVFPSRVAVQQESVIAKLQNAPSGQPATKAAGDKSAHSQDATTVPSADQAGLRPDEIERRAGVKIIRVGGGAAPEALVIDVAKALNTGIPAAADPQLIEQSQYGPIPRAGADGARPSKVYARPVQSSAAVVSSPRIALLVEGLGLAGRATEAAISALPGAITLGFASYGAGLAGQTALARQTGHELILQIPMEPRDFPRENPGPHTLLAGAGKAANIDNLAWLMSRFAGYAGVTGSLGGKFTAGEKALAPVLREIARRGLFYLDDGTSSQSLVMTLAPDEGLAAARADIVIDSVGEPEAIEAALARLEAIARDKGVAIGVANALPASIAAIDRFARALDAHGIALVPLSAAIASKQSGMAVSSRS